RVGREVRKLMLELTPQVEPLSIDEAFMDLTGTDRLHAMSPARALARFAKRVESEIGITVSIGLSANKFLAKIASDLDKPRGFAVLGRDEAVAFLSPKPVGFIWGVGKASAARLQRDGFSTVADLQRADENDLMKRYGIEGRRLWRLARGIDDRTVNPDRETKSVSSETTFSEDIADYKPLEKTLWSLAEKVSARLKSSALSGSTVQLKLKTADFRLRTRARSLAEPTQLAARIFAAGKDLLAREIDGTKFRLIGIGVSNIDSAERADSADFVDLRAKRSKEAEQAIDKVRKKFGKAAVVKGLVFDGTIDDGEEEESTTSRPR
ncbi:MAG: DNA polymerase IV, partial [Alphaproteobacteria bacterium]|nr:DNA polymerase IV [Alphaproteobacteria bacterium]